MIVINRQKTECIDKKAFAQLFWAKAFFIVEKNRNPKKLFSPIFKQKNFFLILEKRFEELADFGYNRIIKFI